MGRWLVCPLPLEILVDVFLKINVIEFEELLCRYIAIEVVVIGAAFLVYALQKPLRSSP